MFVGESGVTRNLIQMIKRFGSKREDEETDGSQS